MRNIEARPARVPAKICYLCPAINALARLITLGLIWANKLVVSRKLDRDL